MNYPENETGNENSQTYQAAIVTLIYHQILVTNLQRNVWQQEGRIDKQILRVKGFLKRDLL